MNREYLQIHGEVRCKRGKADTHNCIDCGKPAKDWSHKHNTDPQNIMNYDPRCRSCHNLYDGPRGGAPIGNKNSSGHSNRLGQFNTVEHNSKISATRIAKYGVPGEVIVCVRAMYQSGKSQRSIANYFNISTITVGRIIRREKRFADA